MVILFLCLLLVWLDGYISDTDNCVNSEENSILTSLLQMRQDHSTNKDDRIHSHVFKEHMPRLSSRVDLVKSNRISLDYVHEVVFAIRQKNMDELTRILHDVSDPLSSNYGQHLTREEVAYLTSNPESRDAVVSYLSSNGASVISETLSGEYIRAKAPIAVWEVMFNTEFFAFHKTHFDQRVERVVRAEKYWVPRELDLHVESIFNTIEMPIVSFGNLALHPLPHVESSDSSFNLQLVKYPGFMYPAIIKSFYNISSGTNGSVSSTQGVFASDNSYYSPTDLNVFLTRMSTRAYPVTNSYGNHSSYSICLSAGSRGNCTKGNLDLQYIMSTSPISPTTYWYTDLSITDWLITVVNSVNVPLVLAISYGVQERSVSDSVLSAFSIQAIKLGAMGVTIVAASGDNGANDEAVNFYGEDSCEYTAIFPASNPYVTSVGGTSVRISLFELPSRTLSSLIVTTSTFAGSGIRNSRGCVSV